MLTPRRVVLSSPRTKKLLWAAVTGDRHIVLVGTRLTRNARTTPTVPSLRQFIGGASPRVIVEVAPAPQYTRARGWQP